MEDCCLYPWRFGRALVLPVATVAERRSRRRESKRHKKKDVLSAAVAGGPARSVAVVEKSFGLDRVL